MLFQYNQETPLVILVLQLWPIRLCVLHLCDLVVIRVVIGQEAGVVDARLLLAGAEMGDTALLTSLEAVVIVFHATMDGYVIHGLVSQEAAMICTSQQLLHLGLLESERKTYFHSLTKIYIIHNK